MAARIVTLKPNQRWTLGYPIPDSRRMFFRINNDYPVSVYVLDKQNLDLAKAGKQFVSFHGGFDIRNQYETFQLDPQLQGTDVFFVIEATGPAATKVQWEAGTTVPAASAGALSSGW